MTNVKIPIGESFIIIETDTENDLLIAIRAAKTLLEDNRKTEANVSNDTITKSEIRSPRNSQFDGLNKKESLYIAIKDLESKHTERVSFTAREVYDHLLKMGGSYKSSSEDPVHTVRQYLRSDDRVTSTGDGYVSIERHKVAQAKNAARTLLNQQDG